MTWQDELRRLDEEMTAGRLSSDDYQRRRDELLAGQQAQGQNQGPGQNQGQGQNQGGAAEAPKSPGSPFPPAFRWEAAEPSDSGTSGTETTQTFERVSDADDRSSEQTQVVSRPAQPPNNPFDDSERTQVVQAGLPPPPAYGGPTYEQQGSLFTPAQNSAPPWGQRDSAPPWASDVPPIQEPNSSWMMQGPEFFEKQERPGNTGRVLAIAGAVVLVLVLAVGAFLLLRPSGTDQAGPAQPPAAQAPGPPPAPAPPLGPPLAALSGDVKDTSALKDFSQVNQLGYLTDGEMQALAEAGPGEARFGLADDGPFRSIILVVKAREAEAARDRLADMQVQFNNLTERSGPPGVRVAGNDDVASGPRVLRRAHYVSNGYVVRVEVTGDNEEQVQSRFDQLLGAQLAKMPADR